ncbi:precorrin-6y C5,15-methyltransferase (decarboxylating) subunit CbiE [Conexibacter sp. JD483]|uniref:precorrin-6y C5,15-methyltransferase (decarboxylating) subunit CbiE n=1 Tax=unclassified Conexibacter TaxID=2627773 RepID=UPI00271F71A6|nr:MULTISPECIES: precorrin-6y C5,15-methyltransferase (decarboxylating) subunit CbiE [unclassified Conexibacter]MDO8189337.1 precorrin-6y C5,15-methyltransferase (decarboxylating) subunit CbiE [Conexibacter sp. CPCC 205706]MDO8201396.1 precorrin-6y C5,15-methyltransferase (decarboxylating) subunit CbiE [Conexibacter sp. CPCC 205762]MDR9372398.1 precorrin-6y C5,15-methyltransferase (decarboxylating) subunit CbiE [Conexibacter sp. JD483]
MSVRLTVVGIGADGWDGLGGAGRAAVAAATLLVGSARQLELVPESATATAAGARRLAWPSPLEPLLDALAAGRHGDAVVLASGDPMLHGIGASLARRVADDAKQGAGAADGGAELAVIPHPSAFALACARMLWAEQETELVSTVARAPEQVARALQTGRRLIVYATGSDGAATIARVLRTRGFGTSRFVVLEQLGGADEARHETTAAGWGDRAADPLHAIAIEVRADQGGEGLSLTPGLPDDAFDHDGQITKRHVRAVTLAALAPRPGELLFDLGAGSGSIAIEWLRALAAIPAATPGKAVAFEANEARARRIAENAARLGAPQLTVIRGRLPAVLGDALIDPGKPDAVFVGGGLTAAGVLDAAWHVLKPGGRIVANAVTLESQARLLTAREQHGGTLTQIAIAHAAPVGGFSGWRAQMPVVQWEARKPQERPLA